VKTKCPQGFFVVFAVCFSLKAISSIRRKMQHVAFTLFQCKKVLENERSQTTQDSRPAAAVQPSHNLCNADVGAFTSPYADRCVQ